VFTVFVFTCAPTLIRSQSGLVTELSYSSLHRCRNLTGLYPLLGEGVESSLSTKVAMLFSYIETCTHNDVTNMNV